LVPLVGVELTTFSLRMTGFPYLPVLISAYTININQQLTSNLLDG
jgi:hypothetical protein